MKNKKLLTQIGAVGIGLLLIVGLLVFLPNLMKVSSPAVPNDTEKQQAYTKMANAQLPFIKNVGQTNPEVAFFSQLVNGTFYVEKNGTLTYSFLTRQKNDANSTVNQGESTTPSGKRAVNKEFNLFALKENFTGKETLTPRGEDPTNINVNYFIGNDETQWHENVENYNSINLGKVFQGVSVRVKAHGNNVEKIYTVEPKADPRNIAMKLDGAENIAVNANGELEIKTAEGSIKFTKPVAYQQINGTKKEVQVGYKTLSKESYGFEIGNYDQNSELIIDPLLSATYLGGSNWEGEKEVLGGNTNMIISGGSLYMTAYTNSSNFPVTGGSYDGTLSGTSDAFISKFSLDLGTLQASTFLGGSGNEGEPTLTADASGNIFIIGNTQSTDFPGTAGHYQAANAGGQDAFIAKMDSGLTSLLAATYLGGSNYDWGNAIMIGANGNVYVAVDSTAGYPTTAVNASAGFDTTRSGTYNIAVSELDSNLSTGFYTMTYFGANNYYGALAQDSSGDIFLTGGCSGSGPSSPMNGPITSAGNPDGSFPMVRATTGIASYQETAGGSCDSFVAKFSSDLTTLKATTLFGGPNWENDFTDTIVVRGSGANEQVFITGDSRDTISTANGGLKQALENNSHTIDNNPSPTSKVATFGPLSDSTTGHSGDDVYVAKFDGNLTAASVAILGGSSTDNVPFITLNSAGEVYLTADTYSTDFPTTTGAISTDPGDNDVDLIGAKLSNDLGTLIGSSYITGAGYDNYPGSIVVNEINGSEDVYINGETTSTALPGVSNGYQTTNSGAGDLFISKSNCNFAKVCPPTGLNAIAGDSLATLTWTAPVGNDVPITDYIIHYSDDNFVTHNYIFTDGISTATTTTVTGLTNGTPYFFYVIAAVDSGNLSPPSNTATATPPGGQTIPAAITDLSGTVGDTQVTLNWTAPNDGGSPITGYRIRYGLSGGANPCNPPATYVYDMTCFDIPSDSTNPSQTITNLTNGSSYIFAVYAQNAVGTGDRSNTIDVTPAGISTGKVEVHISQSDVGNYFDILTGITDGSGAPRAAGHFINSFGGFYNYFGPLGTPPTLPSAVEYNFDGTGSVIESPITPNFDVMDANATIISDNSPCPDACTTLGDDGLSSVITTPFTVHIFDKDTNKIIIGSNGFIYAQNAQDTPTDIPWTSTPTVTTCCTDTMDNMTQQGSDFMIAGVGSDLNTSFKGLNGPGTVSTEVFGTAPYRRFVIDFYNINKGGLYDYSTAIPNSFQIKLFETQPPASPPGTPVNLVATGANSSASLTWAAGRGGAPASYTIRYGQSIGANVCDPTNPLDTNCLTTTSTTTSKTVTGLTNGITYIFAVYAENILGTSGASNTATATPTAKCGFISVATNFVNSLAVKADGTLWSWGSNDNSQLGYPTVGDNSTVTQIDGLTGITSASTGRHALFAVKNDGTLWVWGTNSNGEFGVSPATTASSITPIQVTFPGSVTVVKVSAGESHVLALDSNNNVWAWGSNWNGQVGDGTTTEVDTPTIVLTNAKDIAAGNWFSLAVQQDGTVRGWGANGSGQLGNYSTFDSYTPVQVETVTSGDIPNYLQNIVSVSAGNTFSLALDSSGNIWSWGQNNYGQLGYNAAGYQAYAGQISGLSNITSISAGRFNGMALKNDTTVWEWGENDGGQLGTGGTDRVAHPSPAQVEGISGITAIAGGRYHSLALNDNGASTISVWGNNGFGQLGTGNFESSYIPTTAVYSFICISPPGAPELSGTAGDGSANLTWTIPNDNGSPIVGFSIRYGEAMGANVCDPATPPYTNCSTATALPTDTTQTIPQLNNESTYNFMVYAENAGGSTGSNMVTIIPSASANCPGLTGNESCAVTRIQAGNLSFTKIPDNTSFTNAQNNTNLPSFTNPNGTDIADIMSVSDLRDDPAGGYEVQISATPFATSDNLNFIPLQYLYVGSSLPRTPGATEDETNGIEYAAGCSGPTNDVTSSVNVPEPPTIPNPTSIPNSLGILGTFTSYGNNLGNGNITVPVVLQTAPSAARVCTISNAISYAVDLPGLVTSLGTNIPPGTYTVTFTYTLISH